VHRFLGEVEIPEQANQRGENASRVGAIDGLNDLTRERAVRGGYPFISQIGRTSMLPTRVPGIFDATWIASLRSFASMR
jgi:hypothetical protein